MTSIFTYDLYDGKEISFRELVLKLTKSERARIDHKNAIKIREIEERLAEVRDWDEETAIVQAQEEYRKTCEARLHYNRDAEARQQRFEAMLAQVNAWEPPTGNHSWVKETLVEILESEIRTECSPLALPTLPSGSEFKSRTFNWLEEELTHYRAKYAKELLEANKRDAWNKALLDSLPE